MLVRPVTSPNFGIRFSNGTDIETNIEHHGDGRYTETAVIKENFNDKDKPQKVTRDVTIHAFGNIEMYHNVYNYNSAGFNGTNEKENIIDSNHSKSVLEGTEHRLSSESTEKVIYDNDGNESTRTSHFVSYNKNGTIGTNNYFYDYKTGERKDEHIRKNSDGDVLYLHREETKPNSREKNTTRYYRNQDGSGVRERWTDGIRNNQIVRYNVYRIKGPDVKYDTDFNYVNIQA